MALRSALLLSVAVVIRCSPKDESGPPALADSLGVSLIEYPTTFEASSDRTWSTDPEPLLSIGQPAPELYRVRTALFLSDGGIVVANGGNHELLLFDDAGQQLARAGGEGSGPGEFRQLTFLSVGAADSLFAYDAREHRLSVFDRNGVFARAVTLQGLDTLGNAEQVGVLHSGEIVGAFHRRTPGVGLVRDSILVTTFALSGEPAVPLGVFPHFYTHWGPHADPYHWGKAAFPLPVALSGVTSVSLGDTSIYVGLPDSYSLIRLDLNGKRRVSRQLGSLEAVTEVHRARLFAVLANGRMNAQELEFLRGLKGATTLPAFGFEPLTHLIGESALLVTDMGGVWLKPFRLPDDPVNPAWPRFDADGFYEGTATMLPRFRPTAVREDVVLGVYRDTTDVEYVRMYALRKNGRP